MADDTEGTARPMNPTRTRRSRLLAGAYPGRRTGIHPGSGPRQAFAAICADALTLRPSSTLAAEYARRHRSDQPDLLELGLDDLLVERLHDVLVGAGVQRACDVGDIVLGG